MKQYIVLLMLAFARLVSHAQEITVNSRVTDVTIYSSQARETRTATANVRKGTSQIIITGVTTAMIDASTQVALKGEASLLSMTVRMNHFFNVDYGVNQAKAMSLGDSIENIDRQILWLNEERSIAQDELLLLQNLINGAPPKDGWSTKDIETLADIHRKRMTELRKNIFDAGYREAALSVRRDEINGELAKLQPEPKPPLKEIVLMVSADADATLQLKLNYLISNASWRPTYDMHVANVNSPVELTYRAIVQQSTGIDWKDVKLTFSTANPVANNNRPILMPVYLDYMMYTVQTNNNGYFGTTNSAYYNMTVADTSVLPQATATVIDYDMLVAFELPQAQSIPSDGREYSFKLKELEMPAKYIYHAVPKKDNAAFLLAKVSDYAKYQLLRGEANVFFADNYIGKVQIDPKITSDTLLVSLGRDERIIVQRQRMDNKCSKKMFTDKQEEVIVYEITVRNNKSTPIEIEILDQIPRSRRKEIEVQLKDDGGADYTERIGLLKWEMKIDPGKTKRVSFEYKVTAPKDSNLQEVN